MTKVRFHLEPDARTRREGQALADFIRDLTRPTPSMRRQVGDAVREGFVENFRRERSGAGAWRPLAQRTVMQRLEQGFGGRHPILQRTRRYRDTFIDRANPDHVEEFRHLGDGWEGEWGSSSRLVATHEDGAIIGSRKVPARPVTILDTRGRRRIGDVLDRLYRTMEP